MLNYLKKIELKNKLCINIAYINNDNNLSILNLLSFNIASKENSEFKYGKKKSDQLDLILDNLLINLEKIK